MTSVCDSCANGAPRGSAGLQQSEVTPQTASACRVRAGLRMCVGCAALCSCNEGFDIGISSAVGPSLQKDLSLSDEQLEFFMGSLNLAALVGVLVIPSISDNYGRRPALAFATWLAVVGMFIIVSSSSYKIIIIGRMIAGLGLGCGLPVVPVYISEISPKEQRGALVCCSEIATNVGILLGFIAGFGFESFPPGVDWRCMIAIGVALPIVVLVMILYIMPESPRWLVRQNREEEAVVVLKQLCPPSLCEKFSIPCGEHATGIYVDDVLSEIKESVAMDARNQAGTSWMSVIFPSRPLRRTLLISVGIASCQQLVGINAVQYFLMPLMETSGVSSRFDRFLYLVGLGIIKLACIFVAAKLFDSLGRRPLMLTSCLIMIGALSLLAYNFATGSKTPKLAVFALAIYFSAFSVGMGPGCWLVPGEILPSAIRAKAMSLASFTNRILAGVMASTPLSLARALGWDGFMLFLIFLNVGVVSFIATMMPETKGTSLEELGGGDHHSLHESCRDHRRTADEGVQLGTLRVGRPVGD